LGFHADEYRYAVVPEEIWLICPLLDW